MPTFVDNVYFKSKHTTGSCRVQQRKQHISDPQPAKPSPSTCLEKRDYNN